MWNYNIKAYGIVLVGSVELLHYLLSLCFYFKQDLHSPPPPPPPLHTSIFPTSTSTSYYFLHPPRHVYVTLTAPVRDTRGRECFPSFGSRWIWSKLWSPREAQTMAQLQAVPAPTNSRGLPSSMETQALALALPHTPRLARLSRILR